MTTIENMAVRPGKKAILPAAEDFLRIAGIEKSDSKAFAESIPFSLNDATVGSESELQTAVEGDRRDVDLPRYILESNYFKNIVKKASVGDSSYRIVTALEKYIEGNSDKIWENSWVRIQYGLLSANSRRAFERDLLADKQNWHTGRRKDSGRFFMEKEGKRWLRVPVSYVLKLALVEAVNEIDTHPIIRNTAERLVNHFLNDNTSPETHSFYTSDSSRGPIGKSAAEETLLRFLLCQFLIQFANRRFQLIRNGQRISIYFAPHPPIRQKALNDMIPDSFYRELFMNPCLSGWDRGEEKHRYMRLCHKVLSRSQLNAISKLKEAGVISRNLVVLPNTSNISLANNGVHVSLGSKKLTALLADGGSELNASHEKYFGDLVIKIVEHFLPLFVGTYTAAPYRLDFMDFHPETLLGFLPHELESTHLRMIWRRWKKKANLRVFGKSVTPFGPEWIDRLASRAFFLKGDYVKDFRLIDYLAALLSTEQSSALNGELNSELELKKDLTSLGIFNETMPLYLLYRLRQFDKMGFSGFEGRHFSLFENHIDDMAEAVDLQILITALAYKCIMTKKTSHPEIPDNPFVESERRQIFFATAIGVPTFYVLKTSANRFLGEILRKTGNTRMSRRYADFIRVPVHDYRLALLDFIRESAPDLIDAFNMRTTVENLEMRLKNPRTCSTAGKLAKDILDSAGFRDPMHMTGNEFNRTAEHYYRNTLKKRHMREAIECFKKEARRLDSLQNWREGKYNAALMSILDGHNAVHFISSAENDAADETMSEKTIVGLVQLLLLVINKKIDES